jgi:hypothetical protein
MRRAFPDFGYDLSVQTVDMSRKDQPVLSRTIGVFTMLNIVMPKRRLLARPRLEAAHFYSNTALLHPILWREIGFDDQEPAGSIYVNGAEHQVGVHTEIDDEAQKLKLETWYGDSQAQGIDITPEMLAAQTAITLGVAQIALQSAGLGPTETQIQSGYYYWYPTDAERYGRSHEIQRANYLDLHQQPLADVHQRVV